MPRFLIMPSPLPRPYPTAIAAVAASSLILLSACGQNTPTPQPADTTVPADAPLSTVAPTPSTPVAAASPEPATSDAAALIPEAEKGETGARAVLLTWARALENGDYDTAYAQWGEDGSRSRMDKAAHASFWRKYRTITVAVPTGTMDAGAGSLFYEAPAVVTGTNQAGKPYRLEGVIRLRRVNDVPGATAAQLRWHIEQADLKTA